MRDLYHREFIGKISIYDLDPIGYRVSLNFNKSEVPVDIIADLPDDQFLPYIREELRKRKFYRVEYCELTKLPHTKPIICNE